jgi:hypothetical protein
MRTAYSLAAMFVLSMLCASCSFPADGEPRQPSASSADAEPRWPHSPDELALSFTVKEALEEGPVVCTVTIKNVSTIPLKYATSADDKGAYCSVDADWSARKQPLVQRFSFCGFDGPYERRLRPGETASETFYLHKPFLSIPPGKAAVQFGWRAYRIVEKSDDKDRGRGQLDLLFELKDKQTVEVPPATEVNVASVLRRLEAKFPEAAMSVEARSEHEWPGGEAAADFVSTMDGCRHKEFVPLLLRAIDPLHGENFRRRLIGTVYECVATPEEGFSALADYIASPCPVADEVFDYWTEEDEAHKDSDRRQERLKKPLPAESDPEKAKIQELLREVTRADEDAWRDSKKHLDTRLTPEQFARLRAVKDVWVRTLLYSHYPDQCPAGWVDALFNDLKQLTQPPERFRDLMAKLGDDDFEVREQATAELIRSGAEFAPYLWAAPQDKLSPEAANRLRRVLQRVEKPELPRLWQRTISHVGWYAEQPQNRKLLDTLRTSDCPSLIGRAAQQAFDEHEKREEEEAARNRRIENQDANK